MRKGMWGWIRGGDCEKRDVGGRGGGDCEERDVGMEKRRGL